MWKGFKVVRGFAATQPEQHEQLKSSHKEWLPGFEYKPLTQAWAPGAQTPPTQVLSATKPSTLYDNFPYFRLG